MTVAVVSPSSALVATISNNNSVVLWNTSTGDVVSTLAKHDSAAACCCIEWSSDGTLIAVGTCDGGISVWEVATGLQRVSLKCSTAAAVKVVKMSVDERFLAAAVDQVSPCVDVFDAHAASLLTSTAFKGSALQLQWSSDGRTLKDVHSAIWNTP
jgi:WD40 repeat protein